MQPLVRRIALRDPIQAVLLLLILGVSVATAEAPPRSPKLVICGGGSTPAAIFQRFRALAGPEPRLVVIPTASQRTIKPDEVKKRWAARGFPQVDILHSNDRQRVAEADFIKPLATANAVWFDGGSQQRIADAYLGTPVERALQQLVQRGGVIGGTSAGAAIQSRVMIASGTTEPKISVGIDLLHGAIIDQHFLPRHRLPRLLSAVRAHPQRIGIGMDEGTAVIVEGGRAVVLGASYVLRIHSTDGQIRVNAYHTGETLPLAN